jgi:transposase InsO family protein
MVQWLAMPDVATMIGVTERSARRIAERNGWLDTAHQWPLDQAGTWRRRKGKGGGIEISSAALPAEAQLRIEIAPAIAAIVSPDTELPVADDAQTDALERSEVARQFDSQPEHRKAEARKRVELLLAIERLSDSGIARCTAFAMVSAESGVAERTLRLWRGKVDGVERHDWRYYLVPRHVGSRGREKEIAADAWDFIRADWLRVECPPFESCWRRLQRAAATHGWELPSKKTVERRLLALPQSVKVAGRKGMDALKQLYPAQKRDRSVFHALQAVNVDGHKWDVMVRWPDGTIGRPLMVAFQDLYSNKLLSWRVDRSENSEAVRLAIGDLVSTWGVPDACWLDNGRAFASKWITGGTPNRYRFRVREEDPAGILTTLGVEIHWTTPYAGQSKPIERMFRDYCSDIAKDPRFAGAWTGNKPDAKPENYGSTAVPIETFLAVVAEGIAEYNARAGRRTDVAQGRSFDDVFHASYRVSPIRRATEEQRRLWLLAAEGIRSRRDGSIELLGNRFWSEQLVDFAQHKLIVRFDPQALHGEIHVYRLDGSYICSAPVIEAVGFADVEAARKHAHARSAWLKSQKAMLDAERVIGIDQVASLMPKAEEPAPPPETKVVRPMFGAGGTALAAIADEETDEHEDRVTAGIGNFLRLVRSQENGADGD